MAGEFDSAWLKWSRAIVHARELQARVAVETSDFETRHPYTARTEYVARRHCVRLVLDTMDELPSDLSLLLGDVANNFRSSLDHLAWALVMSRAVRSVTPSEARRIYFPLAKSDTDFSSHLVPGLLRPRDRRTFRRFQPFWHPGRSKPHSQRKIDQHCLSVLADINRDDKHRVVRPVWAWPRAGAFFIGTPVDCTITRTPTKALGIILEPGAEIQRVFVKRTGPNPDVYLEAHLSVQVTIDARVSLDSWLEQTAFHIRTLLSKFAPAPAGL